MMIDDCSYLLPPPSDQYVSSYAPAGRFVNCVLAGRMHCLLHCGSLNSRHLWTGHGIFLWVDSDVSNNSVSEFKPNLLLIDTNYIHH